MKKSLKLIIPIFFLASTAMAAEVTNEYFEGKRISNGLTCVLAHRQLDYAYPELFISLHSPETENLPVADAALLETMGLDYSTYKALLYGKTPVVAKATKGSYSYELNASSEGQKRTVKIHGISNPDQNRISDGEIILINNQIVKVSISKQAKTWFGSWQKIFQDQCDSFFPR